MHQVNKTWEVLLRLKIPVILHSIQFEILTCTMLKIAFPGLKISKFSWGGGMLPDPPRGSHLWCSYLITLIINIPVNMNTLPKTSATGLCAVCVCLWICCHNLCSYFLVLPYPAWTSSLALYTFDLSEYVKYHIHCIWTAEKDVKTWFPFRPEFFSGFNFTTA